MNIDDATNFDANPILNKDGTYSISWDMGEGNDSIFCGNGPLFITLSLAKLYNFRGFTNPPR